MADRKKSDDFSLVPRSIYPENPDKELPVQLQTTMSMTTDREVPGDVSVNQLPGIGDEAKLTFHGDEGEVHRGAVNTWTWPAIGVKEDSPFGNIHLGTANFSRIIDSHTDSIKLYSSAKSLDTTDNQGRDLKAGNLGVDELHTVLVPGGEGKRDPCRKRSFDNGTDSSMELEPKKYKHDSQTTEDDIHVCEMKTNRPHGMVGLHQTISVNKSQNVINDGSKSMGQESKSDSKDDENSRCEYEDIATSCCQNSLQEETGMVDTDRHVPATVCGKGHLDAEVSREMSDKINKPCMREDEITNSSSGKVANVSASNTTQDESCLHLPCDVLEQSCGINVPPCTSIGIGVTRMKAQSLQKEECGTENGATSICDTDERSGDNSVVPTLPGRAGHIDDENDGPTADGDDMFVSCGEDAETDPGIIRSQRLVINEEYVPGKSEEVEKRLFVTNSSNFRESDLSEGLVNKDEISVTTCVTPALILSPSLSLCQNDISSYSLPAKQENKLNVTELDDTMMESNGTEIPSPFACQFPSEKEQHKAMTDMTNAKDNSALNKFPQYHDNPVERSLTTTESYFFKMLGHNSRNTVDFQEERKTNPGVAFSDQTSIPDVCLLDAEMERHYLNPKQNEKVADVTSNSSEKVSNIIDLLLSMVVKEVSVKDSEDMETNCRETSSSVTSNEKRDFHVRATVYPSEVCVKSPRLHVQVMEQIDELPEVEEHESCVCTKRKGRWECVCTTDDDTDSVYDGEMSTPLEMLPTPDCSQPDSSIYSKVEHLLCCMESLPLDETDDEHDIPMLTAGHCPVSPLEHFSSSPEHTPLHRRSLMGASDELRPSWTGIKIEQWDSPSREESKEKAIEENSMDTSPVVDEQSYKVNVDDQLTAESVRDSEIKLTNTDSKRNQLQAVINSAVEQGCLARPELEERTTTSSNTPSGCSSESSIDEIDEAFFRSSSSYVPLVSRDNKKLDQASSVQVGVSNNQELCADSAAVVFNDEDEEANNFKGIVKRAASPCSNSQSGVANEETIAKSYNINCDSHPKLSLTHNKGIHAETSAPEDDVVTTKEGLSLTDHCDGSLVGLLVSHKCQQVQSIDGTTQGSTCTSSLALLDYNPNVGKASHKEDTAHTSIFTERIPSNEGFHKDMKANSNNFQMAHHLPSTDTCHSNGDVSTASTSLTETTSEKENLPDMTAMFPCKNTAENGAVCNAITPVSHRTPMGYQVEPKEPSCDVMDQTVPDEPLHYIRDHTVEGVPGTESDTGTLYAETSTCHDGKSSSLFYWSPQHISYTEQLVPTKADMSSNDTSSCDVFGVSPLKTCSRPIRVGLSRRQRVQKLHPYNKPKE
ncbi:uncharacterized protein LOC144925007 isoform X2 [Branchiostoma floridae x Branchiostoma belcheri]